MPEIWDYDTLEVSETGYVEGIAFTKEFLGGHTVSASVTSYEYERRGETKMNHVPHVVVTDETGAIIAEPHAWDSENPETAIENAKETAELVYENPQDFVKATV